MTKAFQKGKPRQSKINGQWIFGDFSEGLYLLDTPRSITEQLGSLALVGGRNTFCEKGALIPQYGYVEKAKIDGEYIVAISKDVESGYLFLLANTGNVFLYTPSEGLKKYKTQLTEVSESALMTCRQDELIISDNGKNILFGGYYGKDSTLNTTLASGVPISTFGYFSDITIPADLVDYLWLGKKIDINGIGEATVRAMSPDGTTKIQKAITYGELAPYINTNRWEITGNINVTSSNSTIDLGGGNKIEIVNKEIEEPATVTEYETKITEYHYGSGKGTKHVDRWEFNFYVNDIQISPEDRVISNVINVNYRVVQTNPKVERSLTGTASIYRINNDSITIKGVSNSQEPSELYNLPEVELKLTGAVTQTIPKTVEVPRGEVKPDLLFTFKGTNGDVYDYSFNDVVKSQGANELSYGLYSYSLSRASGGGLHVTIKTGNDTVVADMGLYPFGYFEAIADSPNETINNSAVLIDGEKIKADEVTAIKVRLAHKDTSDLSIGSTTTLSEKAYQEVTFEYVPEEDIDPEEGRILQPRLIAWACNRLFVEDMSGRIYYSEIGVPDSFEEKYGAGYFYGFYGDNSELLSIEEYLGKVLLTKKNGMYTLVIGNTNSSYSEAAGTAANSDIAIKIDKIAELGQEYATDHVIVKEAIYAYDCNSASIVQAASQNVFGSIVAGTTLISADYLNAQNFGIVDRKRCLTYNSEAQVFILYFGEDLTDGIVLTSQGSLFPRKLDRYVQYFIGFNQGVLGIMGDGTIFQDFKRNTVIPLIQPVAEFEAIGVKDNRLIMGSILEVTELNGIEYDIAVTNTDTSYQHIQPYTNYGVDGLNIPPLIYSDRRNDYPSFELQTKWAVKKSNLTRVYAPMSGREGVSITMQFPADVAFCLAALRIPDFSQGE